MMDVSLVTSFLGTMSGIFLACALGMPVPEEITLISAGVLISVKQLPLCLGFIPGLAGIFMSDTILFFLGRHFGSRVFRLPLLRSILTEHRVQWAESLIQRNGPVACIVGRFLPGLRVVLFLTSGALGIKPRVFIAADVLAAVILVSLWISVGNWMGSSFIDATQHARDIKVVLISVAVLLLIINGSWRFITRKRAGHS